MKKIKLYIPNVLLTFLLVFCLIGTEALLLVQRAVLNPTAFKVVAQQQSLADKAYTSLESYFTTRANSTGIPAEVFLDVTDKSALNEGITESVEQAFDYLNGKTAEFHFTMDFTALEGSVETFFSDYADRNGYKKDEVYEAKVASVIEEAEAEILFVADTFKLSTAYRNGWLGKVKRYVGYLNLGVTLCIAASVALMVLLILCNIRQMQLLPYWIGLAAFIAGLLMMVPCLYLTATDFFSSFALKDPQIFAAVVGFLQLITGRAMTMAVVTIVCGVFLFIAFGFLAALGREETAEK